MDNTRIDFEKRKEEINEYFKFLEILNNDAVSLKYKNIDGIQEIMLTTKLQKIFIANTFLLLYNVIESTVRNSIVEIYNKIQDDEVVYSSLSEKIKQIWLHKNGKKFLTNKNKSIEKNLRNIINEVVNSEIVILTKDDIHVSGNIDANEIRILASKIGFEKSNDGRHLADIKIKRNRLAHGEQTFHDIGKDFTYNELNSYKQNTFEYLEDVINKIKSFIHNQKYKFQEEN